MRDGIEVYRLRAPPANDPSADDTPIKESLGVSPKAGVHAVGQSAASRVFTNIPTLIIPPVVMSILEKRGAFVGPRGKVLSTLSQLTLSEGEVCRPTATQG